MSQNDDIQAATEVMTQGLRHAGFSPLQEYSSQDRETDEWRDAEIDIESELTELYEGKYSESVISQVAEDIESDHGPWGSGS